MQPPTRPSAIWHDRGRARSSSTRANSRICVAQPLAGRDRDRRLPRDDRHFLRFLRRHRLLEPQRIIRFQPARQTNRTRRSELAVRTGTVNLPACQPSFTNSPCHLLRDFQPLQAGLASWIERRAYAPGRIEFDGTENPWRRIPRHARRRCRGRRRRQLSRRRRPRLRSDTDTCSCAAAHAHAATPSSCVNRLVQRLADDVLHSAISMPESTPTSVAIRPPRVAAAINAAPASDLDVERIGAEHVMLEHVLDAVNDGVRLRKACGVDLAEPFDAGVRHQLEEYEIPPTPGRRRIAHDEGF